MRQIRWTTEAVDQFEAAVLYVLEKNPEAARRIARTVLDRIEQLALYPGQGRPGEVRGTRELVSAPYVVVYRTNEEIVEILHIWHGAQNWR